MTRSRFTELTSARLVGTIQDQTGAVVSASSLTEATLTLYDVLTGQILNSRDAQDVLGVGSPAEQNGVTLYGNLQTDTDGSTFNFAWLLDPDDNPIVTSRRQLERHRAMFHFVWADGEMLAEFEIEVVNLRKAGAPAWVAASPASAGITIGDTQVAFGDGANTIGGDPGLTYAKGSDVLAVAGAIALGATPATGGQVRVTLGEGVTVRTEDGLTDVNLLRADPSNLTSAITVTIGDPVFAATDVVAISLNGPDGLELSFQFADGSPTAGHGAGFFGYRNSISSNFNNGILLFGRSLTDTGANQTWFGDSVNPVFLRSGSVSACPAGQTAPVTLSVDDAGTIQFVKGSCS